MESDRDSDTSRARVNDIGSCCCSCCCCCCCSAVVVVAAAAVVEVAAELGGAIFCLSWRSLSGGDDVGD